MDIIRRQRPALGRLRGEMNDLFGRFFDDWGGNGWGDSAWVPALDIAEEDKTYTVHVELPGLKAGDVDISVLDNVLTVSGEKKAEETTDGKNYQHVERRYGRFSRSVSLPAGVDPDNVEATFADGVLTIHLPKSEKALPRKIAVKS